MTWDIPGSATVGQSGHTSDHNLITEALTELTTLIPTYNALYYGADPTGDTDSTAAFTAIDTAISNNPATIHIPAGTYKTSVLPTLVQGQNLLGEGAAATQINYTGSSTMLSVNINGSFTGGQYAGKIAGLTLSGYTGTGTTTGLQYGNLQGINISDVSIQGFSGYGIHAQNAASQWAEQSNIQARVIQCGTAVFFDSGSFDYSSYDFTIVTGNGQGGVYLNNGAQLQGCSLRIRGNFYGAVGNTAAVLALGYGNSSDTSYIKNTFIDCAVESAGANTGHYSLYMGSSNQTSQVHNCQGILSFTAEFGVNFQGYYNPSNLPVGFMGPIDDVVMATATPGDAGAIKGGINWVPSGALSGTLFYTSGAYQLYFELGNIFEFTLSTAHTTTNTLNYNGLGTAARKIDLFIKQPASGGPCFIGWPTGTKWAGGTAPTLSTGAGAVDHIVLIYLPDTGFVYGNLVGLNLS